MTAVFPMTFTFFSDLLLLLFLDRKIGLKESVVGNIMFQIMDALAYVHTMGIFHRDIKVTCLLG